MIVYPIVGRHTPPGPSDVSVIIPLYKSRRVIRDQIRRWVQDEGLSVDILYVNNGCPQRSVEAVIEEWARREDAPNFSARVLMLPKNLGFAGGCNAGAFHATGRHLIFLNADTTVTPNWIRPMLSCFDDPAVGVVGNLQIKEGSLHGTVDSAGSQWVWKDLNFIHVGRHWYDGVKLPSPLFVDDMPERLWRVEEREMVTGCCIAMPANLYREIGGFDERYLLGYWEDSELCMTVKERGRKIIYTPRSVIYHKLSHSGSPHGETLNNARRFHRKWVDSGRIDPLVNTRRPLVPPKISNVLLRRAGAHGDVLVAAAIVPALKRRYPGCSVTVQTACPSVLQGHPYVDDVVTEPRPGVAYQLLVDLDMAYERRPHTPMLTAYAEEAGVPVGDCEMAMGRAPVNKPHLKNYVVVHAGRTAWPGRNWIGERWDALVTRIAETGLHVVCVGHGGDRHVPSHADTIGVTSIPELATLIADARLFVGVDSMPFQVAQAVRTPAVCFFGCIDPKLRIINDNVRAVTAPGLGCLGCHHRQPPPKTGLVRCPMGTDACEHGVTVDLFWAAVQAALESHS